MFLWGFLILPIVIIHDAASDRVCEEKRDFTESSLKEHCKSDDFDTPQDYEILQRAAANRQYGECVSAYGFVAVLDNPAVAHPTCIGAIISDRWVLDNCLESSRFKYERIKIGVLINPQNIREYRIQQTIQHSQYKRVPFTKHAYDTQYLFAAKHSLILRKTQKQMLMPRGTCAINLHRSMALPDRGAYSVYLNESQMRSKTMRIIPSTCCNHHFQSYFPSHHQLCISPSQYCVSTLRIKPSECCHSQALMVYSYSLLGVMSWSTGCSVRGGVDPWVFSHVGHYIDWLRSITSIPF